MNIIFYRRIAIVGVERVCITQYASFYGNIHLSLVFFFSVLTLVIFATITRICRVYVEFTSTSAFISKCTVQVQHSRRTGNRSGMNKQDYVGPRALLSRRLRLSRRVGGTGYKIRSAKQVGTHIIIRYPVGAQLYYSALRSVL